MEGDPGTRRYKWFRPRQAARGGIVSHTPTNFGTVSLYNPSTGPHVLVVRTWRHQAAANITYVWGYNNGRLSGTAGNVAPLFPGDAKPQGLVDYQDAAATITGDFEEKSVASGLLFWPHNFPFACIPPGWCLFVQGQSSASPIDCSFEWEAVEIDELEFYY